MEIDPRRIVEYMMTEDAFSKWLGIELLEAKEGYALTRMEVRAEMMNGLGVAHGGIAFSLADSTFAFACNGRNKLSLALDTSINFIKPATKGDTLTAEATEIHNGKSTGLYQVTITNQNQHVIGIFKGVCFRTNREVLAEGK